MSTAFLAAAPYQRLDNPLDRVLGYLDFRKSLKAYGTEIGDACDTRIGGCADQVETDIAAAIKLYGIRVPWTAASLAQYTQVVLRGTFILAKAEGNAAVAEASIDHLRRYIELLFRSPAENPGSSPKN